jgi:hypothetical protein
MYNVSITNQFQPLLLKGRGKVKSISRGDREYQGKLLRLLFRPRIRPLTTYCHYASANTITEHEVPYLFFYLVGVHRVNCTAYVTYT